MQAWGVVAWVLRRGAQDDLEGLPSFLVGHGSPGCEHPLHLWSGARPRDDNSLDGGRSGRGLGDINRTAERWIGAVVRDERGKRSEPPRPAARGGDA